MAIYHCTCQVISRGQGRSAVGAAAYRSGDKLTNEYDGITHDYSNKSGVVYSEIMLCENAPESYRDRATLWNEVERVEKSAKAQLCREYEMALPRELSRDEQKKLVREFVREEFTKKGMCADWSIHDKGDGNPHVHILVTMRPIEQDGSWGTKQKKEYILDKDGNKQYDKKKQTYKCKTVKTTDWDSKEFLQHNRAAWAEAINRELEKKNLPQRVDHRTLKEQGIDRQATIHEGVAARAMEQGRKNREPIIADRCEVNREIKRANIQAAAVDRKISETERSIGQIHANIAWTKVHETAAEIRRSIQAAPGDEFIQRTALDNLSKVEGMASQTMAAQMHNNYHAESFYFSNTGKEIPYLDYQADKARTDAAFLRRQITQNLGVINSVPHFPEYTYGRIDVQFINEDFRADRSERGYNIISRRSEPEKSIIRDVKKSDRELTGIYDTTQLHRLIEQQREARRRGRPAQSREEVLVRQIQESFENLRFMEQKQVFSIAQAHAAVKSLGEQYNVCQGQINEAESMVAKLEAVVKLPHELAEMKKRVDQSKDNPEYMKTQHRQDIMQMKSIMDRMKQANVTDAASLKEAMATIKQYKERIGELKGALAGFSAELEGYKRCIATLDRIDREKGKVPYQEQQKAPATARVEPQAAKPATKEQPQPVREKPAEPKSGHTTAAPAQQAEKKTASVEQPKAAAPQAVIFDTAAVARQLAEYRADILRTTVQATGPTYYQPNLAYRQQAMDIDKYSKAVTEQSATIQEMKEQRNQLTLFQGKQKKALDKDISELESLRRGNLDKLKALGVTDPAKAGEKMQELMGKDAQEQVKVKEAQVNAGAAGRAERAKDAYIALAQSVPADKRRAVLAELERVEKQGGISYGRSEMSMEEVKAEIAAQKELDAILQKHLGTGKEERQQTKGRSQGRGYGE